MFCPHCGKENPDNAKYCIMRKLFWIFIWMQYLILVPSLAAKPTYVKALIDVDAVWTSSGNPYIVDRDVLIDSGVTLRIASGVEIKIDEGKSITIKGNLYAIGTETNSIILTSKGNGRWENLEFEESSRCSLKYCRIEYASYSPIDINTNSAYIGYNTISNNEESIYISDEGSATITNNTISNNGGSIYNNGSATITNNTISNNSGGGISNLVFGSATITNNTISNGGISNDGSATITNNTIFNGGISNDGSATITNNTISNNSAKYGSAIYISSGYILIQRNNIYDNIYGTVCNATADSIDARYNYWGTTNTDIIDAMIYDCYDDFDLGKVCYQPFLDVPVNTNITLPTLPTYDVTLKRLIVDVDVAVERMKALLKTNDESQILSLLNDLPHTFEQVEEEDVKYYKVLLSDVFDIEITRSKK